MVQVSRRTFVRALRDCGSVVLCPGGQAELVYAHCAHVPQPAPPSSSPAPAAADAPPGTRNLTGRLLLPAAPPSGAGPDALNPKASGMHHPPPPLHVSQPPAPEKMDGPGGSSTSDSSSSTASSGPVTPSAGCGPPLGCDSACVTAGAATQGILCAGEAGGRQNGGQQGTAGVTGAVTVGVTAAVTAGVTGATKSHSTTQASAGGTGSMSQAVTARKMVIYAGHKGFVRLAIEQQAHLVPVLALGEVLQVRVRPLLKGVWFHGVMSCMLQGKSD